MWFDIGAVTFDSLKLPLAYHSSHGSLKATVFVVCWVKMQCSRMDSRVCASDDAYIAVSGRRFSTQMWLQRAAHPLI